MANDDCRIEEFFRSKFYSAVTNYASIKITLCGYALNPSDMTWGLRAFGLRTGNCLSDLGAVRTAADITRVRTAQLSFIIDLNQPFGLRRSLLRLKHEFWPASNRMPAGRSDDLT
jgi:hypothetical protein